MVELATGNLAALPAERTYEYFGNVAPASVFDRNFLVMSLVQLGRFAEAAEYQAETIQFAEPTHSPFIVGLSDYAACTLHLQKSDWAKARSLIERWIAGLRAGNVVILLPFAVAASAWVLAQRGEAGEALNRLREGERLLEGFAATGYVGSRAWADHLLGSTCLLLGQFDEARSLGNRVLEFLPL